MVEFIKPLFLQTIICTIEYCGLITVDRAIGPNCTLFLDYENSQVSYLFDWLSFCTEMAILLRNFPRYKDRLENLGSGVALCFFSFLFSLVFTELKSQGCFCTYYQGIKSPNVLCSILLLLLCCLDSWFLGTCRHLWWS